MPPKKTQPAEVKTWKQKPVIVGYTEKSSTILEVDCINPNDAFGYVKENIAELQKDGFTAFEIKDVWVFE